MFFGDWLERREMLSPNKVALIDAVPSTSERSGPGAGQDNQPINIIVSWGIRPDDVIPLNMPLFHTGRLNVLPTPLVHLGGTSIVCAGFDIDQLFYQVENLGVTFFLGVPAMLLMMIQQPRWESLDLSSVRLVMSGGGTCPTVVFEACWDKGGEFKAGYGLTEAGRQHLPAA